MGIPCRPAGRAPSPAGRGPARCSTCRSAAGAAPSCVGCRHALATYETLGDYADQSGGDVALGCAREFEFQGRRLGAALLKEITHLASRSKVKKLLARIVTSREGVIRAFERAGFSQLTVLKNYVKDLQSQEYADIALLVKELQPETT